MQSTPDGQSMAVACVHAPVLTTVYSMQGMLRLLRIVLTMRERDIEPFHVSLVRQAALPFWS